MEQIDVFVAFAFARLCWIGLPLRHRKLISEVDFLRNFEVRKRLLAVCVAHESTRARMIDDIFNLACHEAKIERYNSNAHQSRRLIEFEIATTVLHQQRNAIPRLDSNSQRSSPGVVRATIVARMFVTPDRI